jgi:hypothetical protein
MELPLWVALAELDLPLVCRSPNRLVLPRIAPRLDPGPVTELPEAEEDEDDDEEDEDEFDPVALLPLD